MTLDGQFQIFVRALLTDNPGQAEKLLRIWAGEVDIVDLDPRILRMMPAFQSALRRHGLPTPFPGWVKKFERYWWLNQRWLERSVRPLVEAMCAQGVPVVALKGLAVQASIAQPSLRTMSDIDLWVPEGALLQAQQLLADQGFVVAASAAASWHRDPKRYVLTDHALPMRHLALKMEVDLHWRLGGLMPPHRSKVWMNAALADGVQVAGWPDGLRAMTGLPLVRTVMANGYMDAWSSGIWMLDVKALTEAWTPEVWLTLRETFEADGRLFMWNWAVQTLLEHHFPLPAAVVHAGGGGPARRWRRMVYRGHWSTEDKGVLAWPAVRPFRSAVRLTRLHARGVPLVRKAQVFAAHLLDELEGRKSD